jgi:hypothetical protein
MLNHERESPQAVAAPPAHPGDPAPATVRVLAADARTRARYASLVAESPDASVYQTLEWLDLFRASGETLVFVAIGENAMAPFVCKGRGPFRRALSSPFDTYGGPVASDPGPVVSFAAMRRALGVPTARVVDFAGRVYADEDGCARIPARTHIVDLMDGYAVASARYSDANRRLIRQSGERGVTVAALAGAHEVPVFHRLYRRTMTRWRRPQRYGLAFFRALYDAMVPRDLATFTLAWKDGVAVAGNLVLWFRNQGYDWMWAYDDRRLDVRATNALIDRAVRDAAARGAGSLNLGATPDANEGSTRFKKSFGASARDYTVYASTAPHFAAARALRHGAKRLAASVRSLGR